MSHSDGRSIAPVRWVQHLSVSGLVYNHQRLPDFILMLVHVLPAHLRNIAFTQGNDDLLHPSGLSVVLDALSRARTPEPWRPFWFQ
jgi:hypothetical protein